MSDVRKSITSSVGVLAAVGALLLGNSWRSKIDSSGAPVPNDSLLASRKLAGINQAELIDQDFFREMSKLLKREYVDGITDDQKLASGAVRGMIASLNDTDSLFYDKALFTAVQNSRRGKFEGIGAQFSFQFEPGPAGVHGQVKPDSPPPNQGPVRGTDDTEPPSADSTSGMPQLVVAAVAPGGPADKAGVKVGDVVADVDSKWLFESKSITAYRKAQAEFAKNKITREQYSAIHRDLRLKFERSIMPLKALGRLIEGSTGMVDVKWDRAGSTRETRIAKQSMNVTAVSQDGDLIRLAAFAPGSSDQLRNAIAGRKSVTIDLRGNPSGDFEEMRKCLAALAPTGDYGYIATLKNTRAKAIHVANGNWHPPTVRFLVDATTGGSAEILALALRDKNLAKIEGGNMSKNKNVLQLFSLADGSGYSLVLGRYSPTRPKLHVTRTPKPRMVSLVSEPAENTV